MESVNIVQSGDNATPKYVRATSRMLTDLEADGRLEVDYILETRDGDWVGVEVKLGEAEIDRAASSLRKLASRVARKPSSLVVVTGSSLAYTRDDGVHVIPLGCLGQ